MQVISLLFILSWSLLAWAGKIISWLLTLFSPLLNHIIILSCFHASPPQKSNKNRRLLSRLRMIFLATSQPSLPCNETHMSITLRKHPFHFFEFFSPPNLSFVSGLFSPLPLERLIDAPLYLEIVGHYQWNTVNIGYIANKWVVQIISKNLFSTVVLRGARAYQELLCESVDNGGSKIANFFFLRTCLMDGPLQETRWNSSNGHAAKWVGCSVVELYRARKIKRLAEKGLKGRVT